MKFNQYSFLNVLKQFKNDYGYTPTYEELMEVTGYKSKQTIVNMMRYLSENGYIKVERNKRGFIKMDTLKFVDF